MRRGALISGVAVAVALAIAPAAGAATLVNQVPNQSFSVPTFPSHDYPTDTQDGVGADDFTVPAGEVWTLQSVEALGVAISGSGSDTATVRLYADAPGAPGGPTFTQSAIPVPESCSAGGQCTITVPVSGAPALAPGTHWFSVQTAGDYAWWWGMHPPGTIHGNPAHWQNPGDASGTGCTTFTPLPDCTNPPVFDPGEHRDWLFRLEGQRIDSNFTLGQFHSTNNKIRLDASFASPGEAVVSQAPKKGSGRALLAARKNVKKAKVNVAAPGLKALPVKLTKSARLRLARGKNLKLRVRVKFTATGGVPTSQVAKVKVISVRPAAGAPGFRLAG